MSLVRVLFTAASRSSRERWGNVIRPADKLNINIRNIGYSKRGRFVTVSRYPHRVPLILVRIFRVQVKNCVYVISYLKSFRAKLFLIHEPSSRAEAMLLSDIKALPCLKVGELELRLELDELSPEMKAIALSELRETPELTEKSVAELRELLRANTELHVPINNTDWLLRFLRPCKFYPSSAYELIKRYYEFKLTHKDLYDDLIPSKEENVFLQNIITVLPRRDQHGRRILILELGKKWKPNRCSLDEVFKAVVLFLEAAIMEPESQVAGAVVIFDMNGLSMQQVWQFTPSFAKMIVEWLQECVPIRVKNIHIVNQPYIFGIVFQLFKPFLKEKLKKRILFHGTDRESLFRYIAPKALPQSLGGILDVPVISGAQWLELLMLCDDEYKAINSYGIRRQPQRQ